MFAGDEITEGTILVKDLERALTVRHVRIFENAKAAIDGGSLGSLTMLLIMSVLFSSDIWP
jgi:hypothetical protein